MQTLAAVKEYDARVDANKCVVIHVAERGVFRVRHCKNGSIVLKLLELGKGKPARIPTKPGNAKAGAVSARTLQGMDKAIRNLRAGKRSKPADLKKYAQFAK